MMDGQNLLLRKNNYPTLPTFGWKSPGNLMQMGFSCTHQFLREKQAISFKLYNIRGVGGGRGCYIHMEGSRNSLVQGPFACDLVPESSSRSMHLPSSSTLSQPPAPSHLYILWSPQTYTGTKLSIKPSSSWAFILHFSTLLKQGVFFTWKKEANRINKR